MFGYVIPIQGELKVKEFDQFKAAYCGLCHSLKAHYGFGARFVLNFDFTFLAILLSHGDREVSYSKKRCVARPFQKRRCCEGGESFRQAAGYSLILTHWKLQDAVADSGFVTGIPYRLVAGFLSRAYRKAARDFPEFDAHCRDQLEALRILERENSGDLDRVADTFAAILPHAADCVEDEAERRIFAELLYHTGRWIYLIDAFDDLEKDKQSGNYNPLAVRFEQPDEVQVTITHSANLIATAYNLLPTGKWSGILENIIYLGFPAVTESVFEGRFQHRLGRWERRKEHKRI
ncbi:MAG: DUF5685 family protein [Oscillospiraceae bacterium]|nr:DUF5685 family protein [Oscillospiraceae bacterium]